MIDRWEPLAYHVKAPHQHCRHVDYITLDSLLGQLPRSMGRLVNLPSSGQKR